MTSQPLANRRFFTQGRSPRDLAAILRNEDKSDQCGLYDLDGTLHRGFFPPLLKGITNADLAIFLAWDLPLSYFPGFLSDGIHIYQYEKEHIHYGEENARPQHIQYLVETFRKSLLQLPEITVREAITILPCLQYPYAKEVLGKIRAKGTIISCGYYPIAEAYGKAFDISQVYANPLFSKDPRQQGDIYGAADKARVATGVSGTRYVVIGDTADDLGLARAAKARNAESVVIAIHDRSESLEAEADIISSSWKDLREFLHVFQK